MIQGVLDFNCVVHTRENSISNEQHLEENRFKFIGQCASLLSRFEQGERISVRKAMFDYGISSLPRRVKDLNDGFIKAGSDRRILSTWILKSGKRSHVEYYLNNPN